jgi:hypothetical protein
MKDPAASRSLRAAHEVRVRLPDPRDLLHPVDHQFLQRLHVRRFGHGDDVGQTPTQIRRFDPLNLPDLLRQLGGIDRGGRGDEKRGLS